MNEKSFVYADEEFADIQMLRYKLENFESLTIQQKKYIYYLSKATLVGRDITTDQNGFYNIDIRKCLEVLLKSNHIDKTSSNFEAMKIYLKRVWFSNGIYHHYGCDKFVPDFTEEWFRHEIKKVTPESLPIQRYNNSVDELLDIICPVIFDPKVKPKRVNQAEGDDLIVTSACNFYENVTQQEAEAFYKCMREKSKSDRQPSWGLNSRLVKKGDEIKEEVYSINGIYAPVIRQIVYWLKKACEVAENEQQKKNIKILISYYETGDLKLFDQYNIEWLKEQEGTVDFINGFIEVYGDPLGLKGTWEGLVEYKDEAATRRTRMISDNAQWFEDHSPVDNRFKKVHVKGVIANVICAAMLGGDEYPSTAIGINLPNADWIRAQYGSKSVTIGNLTDAYNRVAQGNGFYQEFVINDATNRLIATYGSLCDNLHTDLHECLGHGSGQLLPGVSPDSLKAYSSTIEEARADLFALYYLADQKLVELGLVPNGEAYKSQYYSYIMNGAITQLVRIKPEYRIEEAHMRNRALIARWCLAHGHGIVELVKHNNKSFISIQNYSALRKLFAQLLAEIQRIKSEGDYNSARMLVEKYSVAVDKDLHFEVLNRYAKLNIAPYKGFINPYMKPVLNKSQEIIDVKLDYTESFTHQMLRYSEEYGVL